MSAQGPRTAAVIPSAGSGTRTGLKTPKAFIPFGGMSLLEYTAAVFRRHPMVHLVQPVVPSAKLASAGKRLARAVADGWCLPPVAGGRERQDSVRGGIRALPGDVELILIHDAARPFVSAALISAVLKAADRHGAAIAAIPVQDTVKKSSGDSFISATVDRGSLWLAQTPQAFRAEVIREAHRWAQAASFLGTDDASLVEALGHPVAIVPGSPLNMKITTGDDIRIARALAGGMA